jgi:hypothetical protein
VIGNITMGSILPIIESSGNQILSIRGNGAGFVRIGGSASVRGLNTNDSLVVGNALEVHGYLYSNGIIQFDGGAVYNGCFWVAGGVGVAWLYNSPSQQQMAFGLTTNCGNQFVIGSYPEFLNDYDHVPQTNPTLYVQSVTDPNTNNTQWVSITHNQTNAVIATGLGDVILDPISEITEVCGVGLKTKEYNATVNDEATISLPANTIGWGTVMAGDNQEFSRFRWTSAAVVTVDESTANVATTDLDTNLCIFDGGTSVSIRNRLGSNLTIRYVIHYS